MQKSFIDAVVTDREEATGAVKELKFRASRDEFRNVVSELTESLKDRPDNDNVRSVRPRSRNPVVIMPSGGRVYLYYNKDGKSKAVVSSTDEDFRRDVEIYFGVSGTGGGVSSSSGGGNNGRSPGEPDHMEPEDFGVDVYTDEDFEFEEYTDEDFEIEEPSGSYEKAGVGNTRGRGKPFSKAEAGYHEPGIGDEPMLNCSDCVHYNGDGTCGVVEGNVDPDGYCEELYADFAFFGRANGPNANITLSAWGDDYKERVSNVHIEEIVDSIKDILNSKFR